MQNELKRNTSSSKSVHIIGCEPRTCVWSSALNNLLLWFYIWQLGKKIWAGEWSTPSITPDGKEKINTLNTSMMMASAFKPKAIKTYKHSESINIFIIQLIKANICWPAFSRQVAGTTWRGTCSLTYQCKWVHRHVYFTRVLKMPINPADETIIKTPFQCLLRQTLLSLLLILLLRDGTTSWP